MNPESRSDPLINQTCAIDDESGVAADITVPPPDHPKGSNPDKEVAPLPSDHLPQPDTPDPLETKTVETPPTEMPHQPPPDSSPIKLLGKRAFNTDGCLDPELEQDTQGAQIGA